MMISLNVVPFLVIFWEISRIIYGLELQSIVICNLRSGQPIFQKS